MFDLLIKYGLIVDGLGNPPFAGEIGIKGDRIGLVRREINLSGQRIIDAKGLVVAPGFIDVHSHSDAIALADPGEDSKVRQGVTTECIGNCGLSMAPSSRQHLLHLQRYVSSLQGGLPLSWDWETIGQYLDRIRNPSRNIATLVGHGTVRIASMGPGNQKPTADELSKMKDLISESMDQGALGLSSGLIYPPGIFADTGELVELCKTVGLRNGIYATHIRGESDSLMEAVNEAIEIGRESGVPVLISHHKAGGKRNWGKVRETLERVERARDEGVDIHLDQYPYTSGSTTLGSILPPWMHDGGIDQAIKRLNDPRMRSRVKTDFEKGIEGWENFVGMAGWERIVLAFCGREKDLEGRSISEIAENRGQDPAETAFDILVEENGEAIMVLHVMAEEDVRTVMKHPLVMVGTDGLPTSGRPHPRAFGTYPRILGKYVREEKLLSMQEAIRKMTSLPAQKLGLKNRGVIAEGKIADLVIFDPSSIKEKSTYLSPRERPEGVEYVLINGSIAIERGRLIDAQKGKILRRGSPP